VIDKFGLFSEKSKSVIRLNAKEVLVINRYFEQMKAEELESGDYTEDAVQAYLQLLMVESMKIGNFPRPDRVTEDFGHVHQFFTLLESEASNINYTTPIRIKTAKEFANALHVHPNYINALLKKHTGQNASTHVRNRILDEAKVLLLQTDWSLQDVGYSIGFAEQPNFNLFFKKNTGITPMEFRKGNQIK